MLVIARSLFATLGPSHSSRRAGKECTHVFYCCRPRCCCSTGTAGHGLLFALATASEMAADCLCLNSRSCLRAGTPHRPLLCSHFICSVHFVVSEPWAESPLPPPLKVGCSDFAQTLTGC